jgi:hypothetical protein
LPCPRPPPFSSARPAVSPALPCAPSDYLQMRLQLALQASRPSSLAQHTMQRSGAGGRLGRPGLLLQRVDALLLRGHLILRRCRPATRRGASTRRHPPLCATAWHLHQPRPRRKPFAPRVTLRPSLEDRVFEEPPRRCGGGVARSARFARSRAAGRRTRRSPGGGDVLRPPGDTGGRVWALLKTWERLMPFVKGAAGACWRQCVNVNEVHPTRSQGHHKKK